MAAEENNKPFVSGNWIQIPINFAALMILYTSISRLLNWDVFMSIPNYEIPFLLDHSRLPYFEFSFDISIFNSWVVFLSISCAVMLLLTQLRYLSTRIFWQSCLPLMGLLVISGFSRYWSVAPDATSSRFNLLLAGALGGIWIGLAFEIKKLRIIFEVFSVAMIVGSLFMVIFKPEFNVGFNSISGTRFSQWNGIFTWKMPAGMIMGFSTIVFLFRLIEWKNDNWLVRIYGLFFFILSMVMTYKSHSMTELLAVVSVINLVAFCAIYLKWGHYLKTVHWWLLGFLAIILLALIWSERGFFLGLIGKNDQLTGRLPLWVNLIPVIKERLFYGYGFGEAFWRNSEYYKPIWGLFPKFLPIFAHNGYLEALMDTGVVGFLLWIIFLGQVAFFSITYFLRERTVSSSLFFSLFVFIFVMNLGNNHLGSYETFTWLLLVSSFVLLASQPKV
jgi:O-antigen ligase